MSTGAGGGSDPSDLICLHVLCLSGEGCVLSVSPGTLRREVCRMILEQLPLVRGAKPLVYHLHTPMVLDQTLQEQGQFYTVVDLRSTRSVFSMETCSRIRSLRGRACLGRLDTDSRCYLLGLFGGPRNFGI
jgi:hypothetical protein